MNKKLIYSIVIIVILLFAGITAFKLFSNAGNQVDIQDASFILPEGYKVTENNISNAEISNGYNSMKIMGYKNENLEKLVNGYISMQKDRNNTVSTSNFTVNDIVVYKVTVNNDTNIVHYWFEYKNKTYTFYTWDANINTDALVKDLITSLKNN